MRPYLTNAFLSSSIQVMLCTCLLKQGLLILCMQYGSSPHWLRHIQICISNLSLQSEQDSVKFNLSLKHIISIDPLNLQKIHIFIAM